MTSAFLMREVITSHITQQISQIDMELQVHYFMYLLDKQSFKVVVHALPKTQQKVEIQYFAICYFLLFILIS